MKGTPTFGKERQKTTRLLLLEDAWFARIDDRYFYYFFGLAWNE